MSITRFKIADNPMVEADRPAIIHMLDPKSILLVDEGHITTEWPHRHYTYTNIDGEREQYTLSIYHMFVTTMDGEEQNVEIEKLLKRAWHWYMSYMSWEDKQMDNEE